MRRPLLRAVFLLAVVAAPTVAGAQVASVAIFGSDTPAVVSDENGARTTAASDFALYELGVMRKRGASPSAMPTGFTTTPVSTMMAVQPISGACASMGQAPPRLLSSRATLGRHAYWPLIANAECRFGLPPGLMDSLVLAESRYNPTVVSPAGAAGLAQLMPGTALDLGVIDRFDPQASIQAGARYLRQLLDRFEGNVPLALAAYNAGPGTVNRVRGIPVNGETPDYVRRVLAYWSAPGVGPMSPALSARQTAQMLGFTPGVTN